MSEHRQGTTRYRWDRYTGKWTDVNGREKPCEPRAIRSADFLRRWLRCSREGRSLQYFMRSYPWLTRGACQKRMRRMRARLLEQEGIQLPLLEWERAPRHLPRGETTGEWARIYRQEMAPQDGPEELPPLAPPSHLPEMTLELDDLGPSRRPVRTAKDRAQTITRDPLLYRADR